MRLAFITRSKEQVLPIQAIFERFGHRVVAPPQVVVVVGGDGTLLTAEREYPGIPKALLKDSEIANLYHDHTAEQLAEALAAGAYTVEERTALEATVHHVKYRAANDVIIRNRLLTHAIRFSLFVNGVQCNGEHIGDGVVIATPMGSTAYYHSITKQSFTEGIGVAFNNIHNMEAPGECLSKLPEESELLVCITRGPGDLGVDNSLHIEELKAGDEIRIRKSDTPVRVVRL